MDIHRLSGLTMALESAGFGVTAGANATVAFSQFDCVVNGEIIAVAAEAAIAVPNDGVTGVAIPDLLDDEATVLLWQVDPHASTTNDAHVKCTRGQVVKVVDGAPTKVPSIGPLLKDHVPIALQYVTNESGAAFDFGTTNWNTTGILSVVKQLATLPARDLVEITDID